MTDGVTVFLTQALLMMQEKIMIRVEGTAMRDGRAVIGGKKSGSAAGDPQMWDYIMIMCDEGQALGQIVAEEDVVYINPISILVDGKPVPWNVGPPM
jgi:hypothetical protein